MNALITSADHALATAASDTVKVAKLVETSVLAVLKKAHSHQVFRMVMYHPMARSLRRDASD
jgi:hypothetical protein